MGTLLRERALFVTIVHDTSLRTDPALEAGRSFYPGRKVMGWGSSPSDDESVRAMLRRLEREERDRQAYVERTRLKQKPDEREEREKEQKDA